jgi:hypothetical protein
MRINTVLYCSFVIVESNVLAVILLACCANKMGCVRDIYTPISPLFEQYCDFLTNLTHKIDVVNV